MIASATFTEISEGAKQIHHALAGKYQGANGEKHKVMGDMTKVRFVPGLGRAAHKLLANIEHASRRLPGAQETRRAMRFETNALRARYGAPIFATFSPDEELIDWHAIEKEFMPSGRCTLRASVKYKNQYALGQWSRDDGLRVCSLCLEGKKSAGTPWQCMECGIWKGQDAFHASQHHSSKLTSRRCVDCPERRKCVACEVRKYEGAFVQYQWEKSANLRCKGGMRVECDELKKRLRCFRCEEEKLAREFLKLGAHNEARLCTECRKTAKKEEK
ncbi:unnamed protein product, partial [Prorocentrum cordatum]